MSFMSTDIPLKFGDSTVDVIGHRSGGNSVTLSLDGPVSVQASLEPANARALAAQLIAAADYAEGLS